MVAPLPPVVDGPIFTITTQVYIDNVLPESNILVYENGVQVGQATSASPGGIWVPLTVGLTLGQMITATQTYTGAAPLAGVTNGMASVPSNEAIPVLALPNPLPSPSFVSWMTTCTDLLYMSGLIPGCMLQVATGSTIVFNDLVTQPSQLFPIPGATPPIPVNSVLQAQQSSGAVASPVVQSLPVAAAGQPTMPVLTNPPLLACQTQIALSDMTPGADWEIVNGGNTWDGLSWWPSWSLGGFPPLQAGPLTAQQSYGRCPDIKAGPILDTTVVRRPPPVPQVSYAPCADVKQLTVSNLVPGEILTVTRVVGMTSSVVGVQGVSSATATVNLPPTFQPTDPAGPVSLELSVTLCGVPAPGHAVVRFPAMGGPYLPPTVQRPLYDCASAVQVTGVHPGSLIQVFSGPVPRSNAVVATVSDPVVDLWWPLATGERISVHVTGCNARRPSAPVQVLPAPARSTPPRSSLL